MAIQHVAGKGQGRLMLYALSTCGWCKKTKALLSELGLAYDYLDVDLLQGAERDAAVAALKRWNPSLSFPTLVVDETRAIAGYQESAIRGLAKA